MTDGPVTPVRTRRMPAPARYDFAGTVGLLGFSRHDPCARPLGDGAFGWATRTPNGPATLVLRRVDVEIEATGYGPGADWVVDRADAIAGLRDDVTGFVEVAAAHPVVAGLARSGIRLPATGRIFQRLLRAVLEQKVTGTEAYRGYSATVRHFRQPAPGPYELLLPPDPAAVAATPYWVFHPFGVEQRRAQTVLRAALVADRLDACADAAEATARLTAIPGIGPWTAAEVVRAAFGDPDVVSVGDYNIPHTVSWALAGEPRGTDARLLELLEPFRGHRGRVCLLLERARMYTPRYAPRARLRSFARF